MDHTYFEKFMDGIYSKRKADILLRDSPEHGLLLHHENGAHNDNILPKFFAKPFKNQHLVREESEGSVPIFRENSATITI